MKARGEQWGQDLGGGWEFSSLSKNPPPTQHTGQLQSHRKINNLKKYICLFTFMFCLFTDSISLQFNSVIHLVFWQYEQYELVSTHLYCTTYILRGLFHHSVNCHTHTQKTAWMWAWTKLLQLQLDLTDLRRFGEHSSRVDVQVACTSG